jgi:hypothetical protein
MMLKVNQNNDGIKLEFLGKLENSELKKEQGGMSAMKRFQSLDRHARVVNEEVSSQFYFSSFHHHHSLYPASVLLCIKSLGM